MTGTNTIVGKAMVRQKLNSRKNSNNSGVQTNMHVPFSMSDEPDLGDKFCGYKRDEYDCPNYEYDGDSLAQATAIIDRPDEIAEYTFSQVQKLIHERHREPASQLEIQLQKAKDLLICVCDVMPEMNEAYATALRTAIRQFLQTECKTLCSQC
jgi:hypothetical protein